LVSLNFNIISSHIQVKNKIYFKFSNVFYRNVSLKNVSLKNVYAIKLTYPITTGFIITFSSDGLKNVFNMGPGFRCTTRHKRRTISSTFFATTHTTANIIDSFCLQVLASSLKIQIIQFLFTN